MLIAIVRTFSVGLCGAFDLEQRYTVNIHTVNSVGGESQKISGGWFAIQLKLELGAKKKIELVWNQQNTRFWTIVQSVKIIRKRRKLKPT